MNHEALTTILSIQNCCDGSKYDRTNHNNNPNNNPWTFLQNQMGVIVDDKDNQTTNNG